MHSKGPDPGDNSTVGTVDAETEGDCIDLVENTSLQFQPLISLPRDYLARLLFWYVLIFCSGVSVYAMNSFQLFTSLKKRNPFS